MNSNIQNQQSYIAEQFMRNERHLITRSRRAMMKIQSWNLSHLPGTDEFFRRQVRDLLRESLLTFVSPGYVILQEGYYYTMTEN